MVIYSVNFPFLLLLLLLLAPRFQFLCQSRSPTDTLTQNLQLTAEIFNASLRRGHDSDCQRGFSMWGKRCTDTFRCLSDINLKLIRCSTFYWRLQTRSQRWKFMRFKNKIIFIWTYKFVFVLQQLFFFLHLFQKNPEKKKRRRTLETWSWSVIASCR